MNTSTCPPTICNKCRQEIRWNAWWVNGLPYHENCAYNITEGTTLTGSLEQLTTPMVKVKCKL